MTDYSMMIRGCEKRQSLLFGSISISHYFISVYLAEKGLQYLPTYKPTLHPEENRIMIILKITSKSYLTFKVNYCIIRRQCSKASNSVILQTTAKLKTFIKADSAITVHTTFLGAAEGFGPVPPVLHSVPSKQQGRSSTAFSTGLHLLPLHCSELMLPSLGGAFPSSVLHGKPHRFTYNRRKKNPL